MPSLGRLIRGVIATGLTVGASAVLNWLSPDGMSLAVAPVVVAAGIGAASSFLSGFGKGGGLSKKDINRMIEQSLAQLTPEAIFKAAKQFLPDVMSFLGPLAQTSIQGLRSRQGALGLLDSGFGATQELGLRGQQSLGASQQAFNQAFQLQNARAQMLNPRGLPVQAPQQNPFLAAFGNSFGGAVGRGTAAAIPNVFPQGGGQQQGFQSFANQFQPGGGFSSGFGGNR